MSFLLPSSDIDGQYMLSEHIAMLAARGIDMSSYIGSGAASVGLAFFFTRRATITGAQFFWPAAAAKTIRVSLWQENTRKEFVDVAVNGAKKYVVNFASKYVIKGTTRYQRWIVSLYDTSGGGQQYPSFSAQNFVPGAPQSFTAIPIFPGHGYIVENYFFSAAGDAVPSTPANLGYAGIDPIFRF